MQYRIRIQRQILHKCRIHQLQNIPCHITHYQNQRQIGNCIFTKFSFEFTHSIISHKFNTSFLINKIQTAYRQSSLQHARIYFSMRISISKPSKLFFRKILALTYISYILYSFSNLISV